MATASITNFGLQSGTDRTVYATWSWSKSNTDHYLVRWYYVPDDGIVFLASEEEVDTKQSTYSAPENAAHVNFVVKPVAKTHTVNSKDVYYWTADWSTTKRYYFKNAPPDTPSAPTVEVNNNFMVGTIDNIEGTASYMQFQTVKRAADADTLLGTSNAQTTTVAYTDTVKVAYGMAYVNHNLNAGYQYRVRARGYNSTSKLYGEWGEYSDFVDTSPATPSKISTCKATSSSSIYLEWSSVVSAETYDLEYATDKSYFDSSNATNSTTGIETTSYTLTGLDSGYEYFFRVRAVNEAGESAYTSIVSCVLGKTPSAPTTWASSTTVAVGGGLILYWIHNSEDNSSQTYAEIELTIGGETSTVTKQNSTDEDEKDLTSYYEIDTSGYSEGTTILWRVRTMGITGEYGDWSVQRTVNVYATPTLEFTIVNADNELIESLESFPFYISAVAGPDTQSPIGYYVTITANEGYETINSIGNTEIVSKGEAVYSNYFDTTEDLMKELSAGDIDLENNVTYTATCEVTMNSGLTASQTAEFTVAWSDELYSPDAEIGYDADTYSVYIHPYCVDEDETLIEGITLSLYRRDYNGEFIELATGLENSENVYVTDPHPALDYARYRVVAISDSTGAVSYYDVPGYPVGETAILIQWDEAWSTFDTVGEDSELADPPWSGSLMRLPYNVDVSDSNDPDVELINYIGRERPVSYYGTQVNESSTWNAEIPKDDKDTLYALRRLSLFMGDVYVREPSGSGYWANVKVSFNQKHCELTIPITLAVTRVEGGA